MKNLFLIISLLICGANAFAQISSNGKIEGVVSDEQNAVVAGATVILIEQPNGQTQTTTSDANGGFSFAPVRNGNYLLRVEAAGFQVIERTITLETDNLTKTVAVELKVSGVGATVTVQAVPERTTASRTDIPLKDLPVTLTQIGSREIRERNHDELVSILRYANNVYSRTNFGVYEHFVIRGFSDVVQMTDGVRNEDRRFNSLINNVESVEVLKGPASALYGNTALGGVINVNRKKPTIDRRNEFTIGGGRFGTTRAAFGSSGKITDENLLYRFDFGFLDSETYRDAPVQSFLVAPTIFWRVSNKDRININYQFNRDNFATDAGFPTINNQIPRLPSNRRFNTPQDRAVATDNNLQIYYNHNFSDNIEVRNVINFRDFRDDYLSAETLVGIAPRTVGRRLFYFDRFRQSIQNQIDFSIRFRTGFVRHKVLTGYDFQRFRQRDDSADRFSGNAASATTSVDIFDPIETSQPRPININNTRFQRNLVNGFFVQDFLELTNKLKTIFTVRYDNFRRRLRNDPRSIKTGEVTTGATTFRQAEAVTGRIGAVYQVLPQFAFYASYGTAFKPLTQVPSDGRNLDPETGDQVEIGQRFEFFRQRLRLTTAAFQINRKNVAIARGGGIFDQAGAQRSRGVEAEIEVAPLERLRILANYGYTDSVYKTFVSGSVNLAGRVPEFVPRHTGSVWTTYDLKNGLGFGVGGRALSRAYTSFFNTIPLAGYAVFDAALFYRKPRYDFTVNFNNFTNRKNYFVGSVYNTQVYPGKPIDVQATLRLRF